VAAEAQTQAALDTATVNLRYTTIASPIAGTVITRNVDVGQTVAASFAAPTLFLIGQDLTKMEVDTSIAEADVGRLAPGMTATFTVDAYPAQVFHGAIRQVRSSPQIVQNVVTYNAVIDVDNPRLELKPGMTANLEVIYADRKDVLRVANAALRFRAPSELAGKAPRTAPPGNKIVWIMRGGEPRSALITTGVSDGTYTEVLAGALRSGDQVVTEANPTHRASGAGRIL
jgi:HlyD family secretion protein